MGEARRRADAFANGRPWPKANTCPRCKSADVAIRRLRTVEAIAEKTPVAQCRRCGCVWEAYPADWVEDVVGAEPCDNCAFRPGSPEIKDRVGWRRLLAGLKDGQEFKCHKGAPMAIDTTAMAAEFDEAWIRQHGRTCAGFHRAIMTQPGWLERRYGLIVDPDNTDPPARGAPGSGGHDR